MTFWFAAAANSASANDIFFMVLIVKILMELFGYGRPGKRFPNVRAARFSELFS